MAALAAQKFIHPQEHIYQLKWVSKDRSLELIYRYTSRHRDTSFNDIILIGQEHFCYCSQDLDIFILFVTREALLCMHLAPGTEFPDSIAKSTSFLQQRQHWENDVLHWSWLEFTNAFAAVTQRTWAKLSGAGVLGSHRSPALPFSVPRQEAAVLGCPCLPAPEQTSPAPPPRRQRCLQGCPHCHHRGHSERGSGEGAKMPSLDRTFFSTAPGISNYKQTVEVLARQPTVRCMGSPANPTPKAAVWAMPVQSKADGDVMGESSLRERVNCIIFPTPWAKLAHDGEKWGGTVLFFLRDIFSLR